MAFNIKKFLQGIKIIPNDSSTIDEAGELEVIKDTTLPPLLGDVYKINFNSGASTNPKSFVVTEKHPATLISKTLVSPVIVSSLNDTITNIPGGSLSLSTTGNQNLEITTAGTGVIKTNSSLNISNLQITDITEDTSSGSNSTLSTPITVVTRLTNSGLVSVDGVPSGSNGQRLTIINATGVDVTVNNETGSTNNQIITGTGANLTLTSNASIDLIYDATSNKWRVIGGVGGSGGGGGGSSSEVVVSFTAGELISSGDAVYVSSGATDGGRTAGRVYKLDATSDSRINFVGVAASSGSSGSAVDVRVAGEVTGLSGLSAGNQVFASVTVPGSYQTTATSTVNQWIVSVGIAKNSSTLVINPSAYSTAIKNVAVQGEFLEMYGATSSATLNISVDVLLVDATSGPVNITLVSPGANPNKTFVIKKIDPTGNAVTLLPAGSETIDGAPNRVITTQFTSVKVITDGANWFVI